MHLRKTDIGQQPNRIKLKLDIVWVNLIKKLLHKPNLSYYFNILVKIVSVLVLYNVGICAAVVTCQQVVICQLPC
jgi:hypothetical protein